MTLNDVERSDVRYAASVALGPITSPSRSLQLDPHCLQQKYSTRNLVSGDILRYDWKRLR